jgi:hypothetical protein
MSYPVEQILALTRVIGQFALKLAEIARTAGQDYAQTGAKATAAFVEQFKELKPGTVPAFNGEGISGLFGDLEKSREESLAKAKAAFDEWQGSYKDLLSQGTGQKELTDAVQSWFQPLLKTFAAEPEKAKAPARAPAKTPETA